jgi:hypothetical protein
MPTASHNRTNVWETASTPHARFRHATTGSAWQRRSTGTEHVMYRYDPDCMPSITYHSLPYACSGGANTLDEARKSYRSNMTWLLGVDRHELPPTVEHLESVVAGMWVRTKVGAVHRDPVSDRMFLQTLLSAGPAQDELRVHLDLASSPGASPVVVIVEPDDTLEAVLAQMTAADVLLVAHPDTQHRVGWVAIHGPDADGADDARPIADHAAVPAISIATLTRACADADCRAVRVHPHRLGVTPRSDASSPIETKSNWAS